VAAAVKGRHAISISRAMADRCHNKLFHSVHPIQTELPCASLLLFPSRGDFAVKR